MTTTRRGFLGLLAGAATAATFMTRFPLLPREVTREFTLPPAWDYLEMGLLRTADREVRAHGYMRVCPEVIPDGDQLLVRGTFPVVTRGRWVTRGVALYRPHGPLLYAQVWDHGTVELMPGNNMQASLRMQLIGDDGSDPNLARRLMSALLQTRVADLA